MRLFAYLLSGERWEKLFIWLFGRTGNASLKSASFFSACEKFLLTNSDLLLWPHSLGLGWLNATSWLCVWWCSHTWDGHGNAIGHLILPLAPFLMSMLWKMDGTLPATVCFGTPSCAWPVTTRILAHECAALCHIAQLHVAGNGNIPHAKPVAGSIPSILHSILIQNGATAGIRGLKAVPRPS